jgi:aspartyl protease family protein
MRCIFQQTLARVVVRVSVAASMLVFLLALVPTTAHAATSVNVVGLFPNKAVVEINGQSPRTLSVGDKVGEVTLLATSASNATFNIDGKKRTLEVGQVHVGKGPVSNAATAGSGGRSIVLAADGRGHFITLGQINGKSVQFLVDTGASAVSISATFAASAGIDFRKGQRALSQTANGVVPVYRVMLDSVTVGDVTLYQVEAMVHEGTSLDVALLGMTFLNRMEMRRDGAAMTLTKRY